ncbi:MAG: hypothetical protein Q9172_004329 [Xanthocarpia lactea]
MQPHQKTWIDLFDIFLKTSESRKPKPLKLLLVALERNLVKNPSQLVKRELVAYVTSKTWQAISLKNGGDGVVKPCLQALRHFMCKHVIRAQDIVLTVSQHSSANGADRTEAQNTPILLDSSSKSRTSHRHLLLFVARLVIKLGRTETHPELLDLFAVHVFPEIVRQDHGSIADFAQALSSKHLQTSNVIACGTADLHINLLLLRAIKEKGAFHAIDRETIEGVATTLLCHTDPRIRLIAFSLVVQSSSPKLPFTQTALSTLPFALPNYHAEVDPKARQDNLALIKRLCLRLAGVLKSLSKENPDLSTTRPPIKRVGPPPKVSTAPELEGASLEQHLAFFVWYRDFLLQELSPTASYQRHVVSLKVIEFFVSNEASFSLYGENSSASKGKRGNSHDPFCHGLLTPLIDLVIDPFDDVRELAASILHSIPRIAWESLMPQDLPKISTLLDSSAKDSVAARGSSFTAYSPTDDAGLNLSFQRAAERAQSTARADHADGLGRLYDLVISLDATPDQKHVWSDTDQLILGRLMGVLDNRIMDAHSDIYSAVKTASLHGMLIAASTLMHSLIAGSQGTRTVQSFQHRHYKTFGDLTFTELRELRHRGAFSTVSQTFADCCIRCVESKDSETQALPGEWYKKTLLCIQQRATALTRRSAGIPALITGILSATPKGDFFDTVMYDLQAMAHTASDINNTDEHLDLPQVHAFNCLKDIFTDARFNVSVEKHVSASLELAVDALITRLNDGTNTHSNKAPSSYRHATSPVYDKFPNVPDLMLRLLTQDDALNSERLQQRITVADALVLRAQRVFPALEIIEQSGIPKMYYSEILQASWSHLEGSVWAIRDKAAKALSYLPNGEAIQTETRRCLQLPPSNQNSLHGRLLYVRYLVARLKSDSEDILAAATKSKLLPELPASAEEHDSRFRTPIIPSKLSPENWRDFVQYLYQDCPTESAFALEAAAKDRCRVFVERLERSTNLDFWELDISQTIFANSGTYRHPQHPEHADHVLHNTGKFLATWSLEDSQSLSTFRRMMTSWSRALKLAQDEHAEVSTRQAAIDSLAEYFENKKVDSNEALENLELFLNLYDSLIDDEEDVRERGAAAVSKLLLSVAAEGDTELVQIPLMVPAARHQLLHFLKIRYRSSSILWTLAVQRLVGRPSYPTLPYTLQQSDQMPHFYSPRTLLGQLRKDDTALFVEERQNLYIDDAQEAGTWSEVLLSLNHTAINLETLGKLEIWTTEGVAALIEVAVTEIDGSLGWTSKPEVFTLGVRILHAAQALIRFSANVSLGVNGDTMRDRLDKLLHVGEESSLNPAWLRMIKKALEKSEDQEPGSR